MPYTPQSGLPFQSGSDTSHDAAIRAELFAQPQCRKYLDWLIACGPTGGTDKEAHRGTGIARASICCRRMELKAQGLIADAGLRREGCTAWRVLPVDLNVVRDTSPRGAYRRKGQ